MSYHISLRRKPSTETALHRSARNQATQSPETIIRHNNLSDQGAPRSDTSNSDANPSSLSGFDEKPSGHAFHQLRIYTDRDASNDVHQVSTPSLTIDHPRITPSQTTAIARQIAPVKTRSVAPMIQRKPPSGTANTIANGHAYNKHVQVQKEFPEIKNVNDFATLINTIMTSPAEHKVLTNGREAFWDGKTVVIYNPKAGDKGTCFRPTAGKSYFDNLV